jgi:hypothetical protein
VLGRCRWADSSLHPRPPQTTLVNLPLLTMQLPPELRKILHQNHMTINVAPGAGLAAGGREGPQPAGSPRLALQQFQN